MGATPPLRFVLALAIAAATVSIYSPTAADCAAPTIDVSARKVAPGDEVVIEGYSWGDACNDTPGLGCDPPPLGEPIEVPPGRYEVVDGRRQGHFIGPPLRVVVDR